MNTPLVRLGLVAAMLAHASLVAGQPVAVVDLKGFKPREVKSAVFSLASSQDLQVDAVGAEASSSRGTFSWVTTMWNGRGDDRRQPWMGNAWILDLNSRRVVWELSSANTNRGQRSTRTFSGVVRLPAGRYEAFYSAFPTMYWTDDKGDTNTAQRFVNWLTDEGFDEFRLSIRGSAAVAATADAERARRSFEDGAIVTLRGDGGQKLRQAGFVLARPTSIEIYTEGEARENTEFDAGWILNADTRERVWKLTWQNSAPAGGAEKNRMARVTKTLPAGRYAAIYATDDSHDASGWNSAPPHDPYAWGLVVRVADPEARAAVKTFAYEHVPAASTIVALTKVGDGESRTRGFTLNRPMNVRVYALGEGSGGRLVDYGWITSGTTRQKVWEMRYAETEPAGGDAKNRAVDRVVHLDKGSYMVHYVSDDSHSFDEWNAAAPPDGQHWGITVLSADGALDKDAIAPFVEQPDPAVIAQLVRLHNDQNPRKTFRLDRETQVRIYALGEGTGRSLADYGWIEDAKTKKTVWEMTYRNSEAAGGADKNRRFDGIVTLPAGEYVLRFETDGSHAFGEWNAAAPDDPEMWGITVYRAR